jgi:hypothetical protein
MISREEALNVLKNGIYYYPASKHYGRQISVFCDFCGKTQLKVSIGYTDKDLCTTCVETLSHQEHYNMTQQSMPKPVIPNPNSVDSILGRYSTMTLMKQDSVIPPNSYGIMTKMFDSSSRKFYDDEYFDIPMTRMYESISRPKPQTKPKEEDSKNGPMTYMQDDRCRK